VAETTVKRLLCRECRRTGKAMGQVYQCSWRICREIKVLSRFEYHMFYVLYPFMTYLLTLPRIIQRRMVKWLMNDELDLEESVLCLIYSSSLL
jgi:hypothetical protein